MKKLALILLIVFAEIYTADAQIRVPRSAVPQQVQKTLMDSTNKATMKNAWYSLADEDYVAAYDYTVFRFTYEGKFVYKLKFMEYTSLPDTVYQDFKMKYDEQYPYDSSWDAYFADGHKEYWILANKKKSKAQYYFKYTIDGELIAKTETNR
ncbi:MAG: hypothetical protein IKQ46_09360 [Bacteroidales bacterium]|nr:hypothetical protein [Bacteroidales bacterium]